MKEQRSCWEKREWKFREINKTNKLLGQLIRKKGKWPGSQVLLCLILPTWPWRKSYLVCLFYLSEPYFPHWQNRENNILSSRLWWRIKVMFVEVLPEFAFPTVSKLLEPTLCKTFGQQNLFSLSMNDYTKVHKILKTTHASAKWLS